jgi:hypothetical protein
MPFAGFGKSHIPFDMFDLERSAEEAKRLGKCERIYHRGQELAWDGREILPMLLSEHGGIRLGETEKRALERIFAIVMWGELAAWRISAQLADRIEPLEARMAATSQAHDEARHFYVMYDYLRELGDVPKSLDRAPRALLDLVLGTDNLAHKLLGMQLQIETLALTIFQTVRETGVEPVLCELLRYFERDEARHVGLGMQYLPTLMKGMGRREMFALVTFQARVLFWALWEAKVLEPDLRTLGIDIRDVFERARRKQLVVTREAWSALGIDFSEERNPVMAALNGAAEWLFPVGDARQSRLARARAAWRAFRNKMDEEIPLSELEVHAAHEIRTARGLVAEGERLGA